MGTVQHKEAAARATLPGVGAKRSDLVVQTNQVAEAVKSSPEYDGHPEIQKSVAAWQAAADAVDKAEQQIQAARLTVSALAAAQAKNVAAWKRSKRSVLALIDGVSGGSAAAIKQWGLGVQSRAPLASTSRAPSGLRAGYSKDLVLQLRWDAVRGERGYVVQMGDGTAQGWGASISCTKSIFVPENVTPGQKLAFRVSVLRKDGQSAWSDALAITAR